MLKQAWSRAADNRFALTRFTFLIGLTLAAFVITSALEAKQERLDSNGRIALIRGLASEIAVAKVPLPRGSHGIFLDAKGQVDQTKAQQELRLNGAAINPGMPVDISKIIFKPTAIVFEVNGGGKKRRKWYQHIEIGMGNATQPIAPQDPNAVFAYGSSITLKFPEKVPDLTVPQTKQILASVLDFNRKAPTKLYSPAIPPQFKDAIKKHEVLVGMDHDTVLSAKGPPDRKVRTDQPDGSEKEDWIYGLPPHVLFVTFDGDTVAKVHQY